MPPVVLKRGDKVYKEECVLCFKNAESKIWCCSVCFEGFCQEHYKLHSKKLGHENFLIVEKRREKANLDEEIQVKKLSKLEIPSEKAKEFEYFYEFEGKDLKLSDLNSLIDAKSFSNLNSTASTSSEDNWSEPSATVCEHALFLQQNPSTDPQSDTCAECELKTNLWKCLSCGALSCGRKQFDGSGGNGHALQHFQSAGHCLAVKLGTISVKSDGLEADIYCYKCDDLILDPELNSHLGILGIDAANSRKTEKSTAELNLDINLTHSYSMKDSSGKDLKELNGSWLKGFTNLGNSCYLASVMQSLRNLNRDTFLARDHDYLKCQISHATECLPCQLKKLYYGLSSTEDIPLSPWMFKIQAAGNNSEFKSARQQDASEFLSHLLQNRFKRIPELSDLVENFEIRLEDLIVCEGCGSQVVNHTTETSLILSSPQNRITCDLEELLQTRFSPESVEGWKCEHCKRSETGNLKKCKMTKLPKYLVIVANRIKINNWVPEKSECHIRGMDSEEPLCLERFCGIKVESTGHVAKVEADPVLMGELLMMGIEENVAKKALIACKNASVDSAMSIIFEGGLSNEDIQEHSAKSIETLTAAGFSESKAKEALDATNGDLERAFDWVFSHPEEVVETKPSDTRSSVVNDFGSKYTLSSFITHKGSSVYCGHYVAHLKNEETGQWNLYNDEKVAEANPNDDSFPIEDAYIYFYKKI